MGSRNEEQGRSEWWRRPAGREQWGLQQPQPGGLDCSPFAGGSGSLTKSLLPTFPEVQESDGPNAPTPTQPTATLGKMSASNHQVEVTKRH
jgi:hypothetical protein